MDSEDDTLRAELEAACQNVRRQLDLQQRSQRSVVGGRGDRIVRQALQDELDQLEEALATLGPRASAFDP
jgi:hypothetical protein